MYGGYVGPKKLPLESLHWHTPLVVGVGVGRGGGGGGATLEPHILLPPLNTVLTVAQTIPQTVTITNNPTKP